MIGTLANWFRRSRLEGDLDRELRYTSTGESPILKRSVCREAKPAGKLRWSWAGSPRYKRKCAMSGSLAG